jgi:CheY-like chemotaxis protein
MGLKIVGKRLVVLVAENNDDDLVFIVRAFKHAGVNADVKQVRDGQEVMDYIEGRGRFEEREQFPLPMLMVLDLRMPGISGSDVIRWVRAHRIVRCLPILVLSDTDRTMDADEAFARSAQCFFSKASDLKKLAGVLGLLACLWKGWDQPGNAKNN